MARFLKNRSNSKGKPPGELIFLGKKKMEAPRIRYFYYTPNKLKEEVIDSLEQVDGYPKEEGVFWLNIDGLHQTSIIEEAGSKFGISKLVLEDILNTDQRPKITVIEQNVCIIVKAIGYNPELQEFVTEQISFVVGPNYLVTFQERMGDHFESVRNRIRNNSGRLRAWNAAYLCYALLDALVDNYMVTIESVGNEIEKQEEQLDNPTKELLDNIYQFKTEILFLRKSVRPVKEIMSRLVKTDVPYFKKEYLRHLEDLEDLVTQATEAVEIYYTLISDQLNIYHTQISNRANDVMKVLTIFASIFIPLTFIAGIYGTNFTYVPELEYRYSYFIMWGFMLVVAGIMLWYFKRKNWF